MLSLFNRNKVVIDFYTNTKKLVENYPIKRGLHYAPDWWKKLPPTFTAPTDNGVMRPSSTVKLCPGFVDLYAKGWVLPAWSDLVIKTTKEGGYAYEFPLGTEWSRVETHSRKQFDGAFKGYMHLKIVCPWVLIDRHKTNTKFLWTPTTWSLVDEHPEIRILPGVIEFTHNIGAHLNMLVPVKDKEYSIEAGTPLVHMVPITEKKVSFEPHVVSSSELDQLHRDNNLLYDFKFLGRRGRTLKTKKELGGDDDT